MPVPAVRFFTAEDGINLRAPGFCNVNQLFDANLLQAGGVEVVKGTGKRSLRLQCHARRGECADKKRGRRPPQSVGFQVGSRDFARRTRLSLKTGGLALNAHGTSYGGYQASSGYDQQKATLRFDGTQGDWSITGVISASNLNQDTAGYIQDGKGAYKSDTARRVNRNPDAYRDASSMRAHLKLERDLGATHASHYPLPAQ